MPRPLAKYWQDLLAPVLRRDTPPTVPQAVVLHEQQVLLVRRDAPYLWELPGGGMAVGESPEATVLREVWEETGLSVDIVAVLGVYTRTGFRAHVSPVYLCRPTGGSLQPQDDDTVQAAYFPLTALPRGLCPWYRPIIQHAMEPTAQMPQNARQHLGLRVVLHCLWLDVTDRLGFFGKTLRCL